MGKLSLGLNLISVILSLAGLIFVQIVSSDHQQNLQDIENIKKTILDTEKKIEELRKENTSKILSQERRNQSLSEEIEEFKNNSQEVFENLAKTKAQINEIENAINETTTKLDGSEAKKLEAEQGLRDQQAQLQMLRNEIPKIQQQIDTKSFEIRDYESRSNELSEQLIVFSSITEALRRHYLDTLSAIRSYARQRPWLEPGEELSVRLGVVDLKSGYIAISEGGTTGLRENMFFAVHSSGEEISKIRIRKVFRTYSLAEIIPLVGNPLRLKAVKEVDLVAL